MLRVHPLISTADLPRAAAFLRALGLSPADDPAPTNSSAVVGAVFDAGSGRVTLRSCAPGSPGSPGSPGNPGNPGNHKEGSTLLAFDVGDVREFARRTVESGTPAEFLGEGPGATARIPAPDGIFFPAGLGPRDTGAPASPLTVVARWYTTDPDSAARVLEDIGAKSRTTPGTGRSYRAKNGGMVVVLAADRTAMDLAFEYEGHVRELLGDLTAVGAEPLIVQEGSGLLLRATAPWGARIIIKEMQPATTGVTAR